MDLNNINIQFDKEQIKANLQKIVHKNDNPIYTQIQNDENELEQDILSLKSYDFPKMSIQQQQNKETTKLSIQKIFELQNSQSINNFIKPNTNKNLLNGYNQNSEIIEENIDRDQSLNMPDQYFDRIPNKKQRFEKLKSQELENNDENENEFRMHASQIQTEIQTETEAEANAKLLLNTKLLYKLKLRTPSFSNQKLDEQATLQYGILFKKCLVDKVSLEFSDEELQQLIQPVIGLIDDKSTQQDADELQKFNDKYNKYYYNCLDLKDYQQLITKLQPFAQLTFDEQKKKKSPELEKILNETELPGVIPEKDQWKEQEPQNLIQIIMKRYGDYQSQINSIFSEIIEEFKSNKEKNIDAIIQSTWDETIAEQPKFCWIKSYFSEVCPTKKTTVKYIPIGKDNEITEERSPKFKRQHGTEDTCVELCTDYFTGLPFPKCFVTKDRRYDNHCNEQELEQEKKRGKKENCKNQSEFGSLKLKIFGSTGKETDKYKTRESIKIDENFVCPEGTKIKGGNKNSRKCEFNVEPKCEDIGYTPCLKINLGCGLRQTDCYDALKKMVLSTMTAIVKISLMILAPGSSFILDLISIFKQIIELALSIGDFIISRLRAADSILTMHPKALGLQVHLAARKAFEKNVEFTGLRDQQTFVSIKNKIIAHVQKLKDTIDQDPGFWDYLIMGITGCQLTECTGSQSGLKLCRDCASDGKQKFKQKLLEQMSKDKEFIQTNMKNAEENLKTAKEEAQSILDQGSNILELIQKKSGEAGKLLAESMKEEEDEEKPSLDLNPDIDLGSIRSSEDLTGAVKGYFDGIKEQANEMSISTLIGDVASKLGKPLSKEQTDSKIYEIFDVLNIKQITELWGVLGEMKNYFKMPKGSDKGNKAYKNVLKSVLSFAEQFDPTGVADMIKSFIHDDCQIVDPSDDFERSQLTKRPQGQELDFKWTEPPKQLNDGSPGNNPSQQPQSQPKPPTNTKIFVEQNPEQYNQNVQKQQNGSKESSTLYIGQSSQLKNPYIEGLQMR